LTSGLDVHAAMAAGSLRLLTLDVARLLRLSRFPKTEPYWGRNQAYRFDDPARNFGVTYAALTLEVAFAETILHQKGHFEDGQWLIDEANINARHVVRYQRVSAPALRLVDLTGSSLKALGLNNDLCSSDDYADSMVVSAALHDGLPDVDGIMYVSRQMNTGLAVALFERSAVALSATVVPLRDHAEYRSMLSTFNVAILPSGRAP
jgi:hypothetical protein